MTEVTEPFADYLAAEGPHMLEIGAQSCKPGWLACDLWPRPKANVHALDATKPFNLPSDSFDCVFSEHMIEHITYKQGEHMLQECYRVLKPGGVIRIITPSLGFLLRAISADRSDLEDAYYKWSVKTWCPDVKNPTAAHFIDNFMRNWSHTFIYDHACMRSTLQDCGFTEVRERELGDSIDPRMRGLENAARMPAGYLALESMIYEGKK